MYLYCFLLDWPRNNFLEQTLRVDIVHILCPRPTPYSSIFSLISNISSPPVLLLLHPLLSFCSSIFYFLSSSFSVVLNHLILWLPLINFLSEKFIKLVSWFREPSLLAVKVHLNFKTCVWSVINFFFFQFLFEVLKIADKMLGLGTGTIESRWRKNKS